MEFHRMDGCHENSVQEPGPAGDGRPDFTGRKSISFRVNGLLAAPPPPDKAPDYWSSLGEKQRKYEEQTLALYQPIRDLISRAREEIRDFRQRYVKALRDYVDESCGDKVIELLSDPPPEMRLESVERKMIEEGVRLFVGSYSHDLDLSKADEILSEFAGRFADWAFAGVQVDIEIPDSGNPGSATVWVCPLEEEYGPFRVPVPEILARC